VGYMHGHINAFDLLDIQLTKVSNTDNDTIRKLHIVAAIIFTYYKNYYYSKDDFNKEGTDFAMFLFDVGMLTGTISYYHQHHSLRKDHIEDLNKMYKKYREVPK